MTETLKSQTFFACDYGSLGEVVIILPENNGGDEQFEQDFDDTLTFVAAIMIRRSRARKAAAAESSPRPDEREIAP